MWLAGFGIVIGAEAIPHALDKPSVVPQGDDARSCKTPGKQATSR
jgi:hypothetical protein